SVANPASVKLTVISSATTSGRANIFLRYAATSFGVAYDGAKGEVFVANQGSNNVSVISDAKNAVVANVLVGSYPAGVAYDGVKGEVFVTNAGSDDVSVISDATNAVVASVPVGSGPIGVAYDGGKGEVFVADY